MTGSHITGSDFFWGFFSQRRKTETLHLVRITPKLFPDSPEDIRTVKECFYLLQQNLGSYARLVTKLE